MRHGNKGSKKWPFGLSLLILTPPNSFLNILSSLSSQDLSSKLPLFQILSSYHSDKMFTIVMLNIQKFSNVIPHAPNVPTMCLKFNSK